MKKFFKILGATIGIIILLILAGGFIQTYRTNHITKQEQFLAGKIPSPFPDGFQKGSANFYTGVWKGKTFYANSGTGINNFGETLKYSFNTYAEKGIHDKDLDVFKIDYNNGKNPFWVAPLLDEIVEVAPGQYLGKITYRLIPGYPFALGYFRLENSNTSTDAIRDITVKGKYFSIKLPQNWKTDFNDAQNVRLSELIAWSQDFKMHTEPAQSTTTSSKTSFDSGMKLDILAEKGLFRVKEKLEGKVLNTEEFTIAGIKTKLNTVIEPNTKQGEILDARLSYQGNSYVFRLAYSPDNAALAKKFLEEKLASFKFLAP